MPLTDLNSIIPSLECANCGKKIGKTFGWLKAHDHFVCGCGARTTWRSDQIADGVKKMTEFRAKGIKKIRRTLKS